MATTGRCLCGGVSYEIEGTLERAGHCHCSICRRSHGAAFATWALVEPNRFHWTAGEGLLTHYESSPDRTRCFCSRCGAPLAATHDGQVTEVVLASVDGDPGVRPGEHIFTAFKAPWYEPADDLPRHAGWPPGLGPDA